MYAQGCKFDSCLCLHTLCVILAALLAVIPAASSHMYAARSTGALQKSMRFGKHDLSDETQVLSQEGGQQRKKAPQLNAVPQPPALQLDTQAATAMVNESHRSWSSEQHHEQGDGSRKRKEEKEEENLQQWGSKGQRKVLTGTCREKQASWSSNWACGLLQTHPRARTLHCVAWLVSLPQPGTAPSEDRHC